MLFYDNYEPTEEEVLHYQKYLNDGIEQKAKEELKKQEKVSKQLEYEDTMAEDIEEVICLGLNAREGLIEDLIDFQLWLNDITYISSKDYEILYDGYNKLTDEELIEKEKENIDTYYYCYGEYY